MCIIVVFSYKKVKQS
jgi:hypothetical protein